MKRKRNHFRTKILKIGFLFFTLFFLGVCSNSQQGILGPVTTNVIPVPMIVFSGESNSGGYAVNSDATPTELAARSQVQILNNTTLTFQDLDVGTNNLIGHAGLPANATHGWELELANLAASGSISSPTYLVKTGQGGTKIADWNVGATSYLSTNCWQLFQDRVDSALILRSIIAAVKFALLYSQGINDALASTDVNTWKAATIAHFAKIRAKYGAAIPIVMTKIPSSVVNYTSYNSAIDEIDAADAYTWSVDVSGLTMRDPNHWDYAGVKPLCDRLIQKLKDNGYGL